MIIEMEKKMDTMQEYRQGARETNIKTLLRQESIGDLVDRFFEYASPETVEGLKDYLVDVCTENNFVDDEELQ